MKKEKATNTSTHESASSLQGIVTSTHSRGTVTSTHCVSAPHCRGTVLASCSCCLSGYSGLYPLKQPFLNRFYLGFVTAVRTVANEEQMEGVCQLSNSMLVFIIAIRL